MTFPDHEHWSETVLGFWFSDLEAEDWFSKNEALDADIQKRFGLLHRRQSKQPPEKFLGSPREALAAIILFDQFSRNLFRGDPRSFSSDPLGLAIARGMAKQGWDREIIREWRVFAYLPFEHSEDLADQDTAVELIGALGDEESTRYARAHRDVIARFDRFPHRNVILGRESTAAEELYLSQPGSGF